VQVLFPGHAAGVKQTRTGPHVEAVGNLFIPFGRIETVDIHAPGEQPQLGRIEPFFDQFPTGLPGGDVDHIHLIVIPDNEFPGQILHTFVAGEDLDVLGQGRVVGAVDGQTQGPGDAQGGQADGAGGGRVDAGVATGVDEMEHFQQRRVEKFLIGVLFDLVDPDGMEVLDARFVDALSLVAGDDGEAFSGPDGQFGLLA